MRALNVNESLKIKLNAVELLKLLNLEVDNELLNDCITTAEERSKRMILYWRNYYYKRVAEHREEYNAIKRAYKQANRDRINEINRASYYKNLEKNKARKQAYREKHREEIKAKNKAYREKHREEIKAKNKAYRERQKNMEYLAV